MYRLSKSGGRTDTRPKSNSAKIESVSRIVDDAGMTSAVNTCRSERLGHLAVSERQDGDPISSQPARMGAIYDDVVERGTY